MKFFLPAVCIFLIGAVVSPVYPGTTGKVSGKVTDAKTKEPLIGVNVSLVGTTLGGVSDVDGNYNILNVPPNTYSVRAAYIGYNPEVVQGISVSLDLTTHQDFQLSESALQQQEVVVTADRNMVQKDLTAKTAIIGKDQIAALPVTEVSDLLSLQAGFTGGTDHLRGGAGEIAYWIDGIPVTDVYDGSQVVQVNKEFIQELQVVSGAYNAEYGQAMSGIVNIATKEGDQKFAGTLSAYGGQYLSGSDAQTGASGKTVAELFPGLNRFDPTSIRDIEGSLSGPLIGNNLTFFANARYIYFGGQYYGYNRFNPWNIAYTDTNGAYHLFRDPSGKGDSSLTPMNWSDRNYEQGKVTWHISPLVKFSVNYIYDKSNYKQFSQSYYYDPNGAGTNHDLSSTVIFQLNHTLNANTFYTIGGSFIDKTHQYYLYQDPTDPRYVNPQDALLLDSYSFQTGGTDMTNYDRETRTEEMKFDISSQVDQTNLLKGGVEFRHHRLYERNIGLQPIQSELSFDPATSNPFVTTTVLPESSLSHSEYTHEPTEFSAYIQDKMEFKDIIVNIGIRWDYFQPDGEVLSDPTDPNIFSPLKPNNQFFDYNGDGIQESNEPTKTLQDRQAYWYRKASAKSQFSPRLGVSFPITATGIVHFSYGHFFQIPRFERLYENPDFKIGSNTGYAGSIGNADLQPEETINAELGVQEQLTDDIGTDLTAYFRDIRNLTGTGTDEQVTTFDPSRWYVRYANKDFGLVKGIVLTITKRFSQGMTATVDYTYQIARGTASDPLEAANAIAGGTLPEIQLNPLQWDQRHTLNVTASYTPHPWGISFIGKYGSGNPYTPVGSVDITSLLTNSANVPAFFDLDSRAFYEFPLNPFKVMVFLRAFNVLNIRNQVQVYARSGSADYTPDEYRALLYNLAKQEANTLQQYYANPTFYSEPRRIEFGCNLEF